MTYDFERLFTSIIDAVASDGSPESRMGAVISECEQQRPHDDWQRFRNIDFSADSASLQPWLAGALSDFGAGKSARGLWFGLFNPVRDGSPSADLYIGVAPQFNALSVEWACEIARPTQDAYLNSTVLFRIYKEAYAANSGLGNDAEYPLALAYAAIAVRDLLRRQGLPARHDALRGAAVGFDSGDGLFLGTFEGRTFIEDVRSA